MITKKIKMYKLDKDENLYQNRGDFKKNLMIFSGFYLEKIKSDLNNLKNEISEFENNTGKDKPLKNQRKQ